MEQKDNYNLFETKPKGFEKDLSYFQPISEDKHCEEPISWGFRIKTFPDKEKFKELGKYGILQYHYKGLRPGIYLVTKWLTEKEAIAKYGKLLRVNAKTISFMDGLTVTTFATDNISEEATCLMDDESDEIDLMLKKAKFLTIKPNTVRVREGIVRAYIRTSTDKQAGSIHTQKVVTSSYAQEKKWNIVYYIDEAISGAKPWSQRPALTQLMEDLKPGDEVVCNSMDRLARGTPSYYHIVWKIEGKRLAKLIILDEFYKRPGGDDACWEMIRLIRSMKDP